MYSIGEFSKITSLSVKTLRLYHEKGILIPSYINREIGYRYYSQRDIERARAVSCLKDMMCSLPEIKQILENCSDDSEIMDFFWQKQKIISKQIEQLKLVSTSIEAVIKKEMEAEKMSDIQDFSIEEKELEEQLVLAMRWCGCYQDTGKAFSKLYRVAGRNVNGSPLNLYYDTEYKENGADIESCVPIKNKVKEKNCELKTLPFGKYITLVHKGPYQEIGRSYKRLFDYIKKIEKEAQTPSREIYIKGPGMIFKGNPKKYLTEIQIPIT